MSMRILIISNLYPPYTIGGYEQACRDTVEGLRARGHRVDVLTSAYGARRPTVARGVHRLLRLEPFWPTATRREATGFRAMLRHTLYSQRTLRTLLRAICPDIVYVWNMTGLPMTLLTLAQRSGVPLVFNIQDDWLPVLLHRDPWVVAWEHQSRSAVRRAAKGGLRALIAPLVPTRPPSVRGESAQYVSRAFAGRYAAQGWRFAREQVIYNGIDLSHFAPAARDRETVAHPHRLLFVGQLTPWKGAHVAIEAVASIARRRGEGTVAATLTIVGAGHDADYQDLLQRLVREHALDGIVTFRGAVPREETAAIYAEHDVLLFPSSWIEGFSLVLLEALASALPVVGTTTGGSAEILEDGVNGLVVPPDDAMALASQVKRLIDDPLLARRLGITGAEVVRQRFDDRHIIALVEDYLGQVVEAARRR